MISALLVPTAHQTSRALTKVIIFVVIGIGSLVLAILDHFTDSPMMRKRVNNGSDQFLEDHNTILRSASISMRTALDFVNNPAGRE